MAVWQVTEQAVQAIRCTSSQLKASAARMTRETETLAAAFEENQAGLGAHAEEIRALLDDVRAAEEKAKVSVEKLILRLQGAALIRQRHIERSAYKRGNGSGKTPAGSPQKSGLRSGGQQTGTISVAERTIFELNALAEGLELTDGDPDVLQIGGCHRDVKRMTSGTGYQSHHIPAKSVFLDNEDDLPTIAIAEDDHRLTSSFGGKMGRSYRPFIPGAAVFPRHKGSIVQQVERGFLAEVIRDEIYELREKHGAKYDGAIKQYIAAMVEYIRKNGVPKTVERP